MQILLAMSAFVRATWNCRIVFWYSKVVNEPHWLINNPYKIDVHGMYFNSNQTLASLIDTPFTITGQTQFLKFWLLGSKFQHLVTLILECMFIITNASSILGREWAWPYEYYLVVNEWYRIIRSLAVPSLCKCSYMQM